MSSRAQRGTCFLSLGVNTTNSASGLSPNEAQNTHLAKYQKCHPERSEGSAFYDEDPQPFAKKIATSAALKPSVRARLYRLRKKSVFQGVGALASMSQRKTPKRQERTSSTARLPPRETQPFAHPLP